MTSSVQGVLEALELFRDRDARLSLNSLVAFLHVCGREGVSMKELAYWSRMPEATASRAIRVLEAPDSLTALTPALGLVVLVQSEQDARSRQVFLSEDGKEFRDALVRNLAPKPASQEEACVQECT